MMPGFPPQSGSKPERKLGKLYRSLNENDQSTLLKFAEFLVASPPNEATKNVADSISLPSSEPFPEPKEIDSPPNENVIKAIKRVSEMYFMVDRTKMLDVTSRLMTEHLMQGREATSVITDLKEAFHKEYEKLRDEHSEEG